MCFTLKHSVLKCFRKTILVFVSEGMELIRYSNQITVGNKRRRWFRVKENTQNINGL